MKYNKAQYSNFQLKSSSSLVCKGNFEEENVFYKECTPLINLLSFKTIKKPIFTSKEM